jgi:DNA gyrase subunit A
VASTHDDLLFFTTAGRLYTLKVYQAPETSRIARGRALVNLLNLRPDEKITAVLPVKEFTENRYVFFATQRGVVKRAELMDFAKVRKGGLIAASLDEGDSLIGVGLTSGKDDINLATADGMSIRFSEEDARVMGRAARGVRGITLEEGDEVVSMTVIPVGEALKLPTLLTVCEFGYGKRTAIEEYRNQSRGGKGLIDIKTDERNGKVVTVCAVADDSEVMLITSGSKIIRTPVGEISVIGRNTKGVRLINLDEGEKVVAVAKLVEAETE